jgi:hypothetical protein
VKQACGCCAGIEIVTPEMEVNRPGLPGIVYRAGTYATFLETMLARVSSFYLDVTADDGTGKVQRTYPLKGLTTRALSDPSIALLDAWATVADVLTFYQERIANEGFLRTATERLSVLELARLVGYKLRPGISASVYLAFTVAAGFDGAIPLGTRAQSIPGVGEKPQFFETSEDLPARDVWNKLKPRLTRPQVITMASDSNGNPLDPGTDARTRDTLYLQGISTNLKTGDALLFVLGEGGGQQRLRQIESIKVQPDQARTEVVLVASSENGGGSSPGDIVANALQPFIEEASSIFADSDLAGQVATSLQELEDNANTAPDTQTAADMVLRVIPLIEERHGVAVKRKFTRLEPWLAHLLDELNSLVQSLPGADTGGGGTGTPQFVPASLKASPLENLLEILDPLAKPPSLQPANGFRLTRSVSDVFAPQSDTAPRLLATFRPPIAKTLYKAWGGVETLSQEVQVFAMRVKTAPFGNNAPLQTVISGGTLQPPVEWDLSQTDQDGSTVYLDSANDKVIPNSWVVLNRTDSGAANQPVYAQILGVRQLSRADYGMAAKTTALSLKSNQSWLTGIVASPKLSILRGVTIYAQSEELDLAEEPLDVDVEKDSIELAQLYDGLESGRWIIVSGERTDIQNTTGVTASELVMISSVVQGSRSPSCAVFPSALVPPTGSLFFSQIYYTTDANSFGDRLMVGALAVDPRLLSLIPLPGEPNQKYCDQVQLAHGTYATAYVPSQAERAGDFSVFEGLLVDPQSLQPYPGGKLSPSEGGVFAWRISTEPVHTILKLANKLSYSYDTSTVTIYGNVVKATHGQTQGEVLGDGDSSQALQKFKLHQAPLTYLPVPTPTGVESTLVVRVNEVEWQEADNLFVLGPNDREYITDTDDNGITTAMTGTGEHGLRVPTGNANVKAVYRSGTGKSGNVQAQQISQLATQPLGAKSVINPLAAGGGADGDTRDQARRNVPIGTLALDRLVSVSDYANFARKFAGIGKASSRRLSDGRQLFVHLTIAGKDDIPIDPNTDLYRALQQALLLAGDPHQPIQIALRRLKVLIISAGVKVLPDYQWETVAVNLRSALLALYSFDNRELGQSAFLSEAVSTMQAVPGVQYVDVRKFDSVAESVTAGQLAGLAGSLGLLSAVSAELAHVSPTATDPSKRILAAELVILTPDIPDTLILTEITT